MGQSSSKTEENERTDNSAIKNGKKDEDKRHVRTKRATTDAPSRDNIGADGMEEKEF